jgi:2-polyprenyl-3-methyl-5-hydroxy-6-metoxy-1,4-benzoquinol methylase
LEKNTMKHTEPLDPTERFAFGKNWAHFLHHLNDDRIAEAEKSLLNMLGVSDLQGKTFLDIGCGSGLFSLAAYRLGATVASFDYDQDSVNCAQYLKEKYATDDTRWQIEQGSVLDKSFLQKFDQADIVYSWGVLHHTGHMYQAFENVASLVKADGHLFISIYNDQGATSKMWTWVKQTYNTSGSLVKAVLTYLSLWRLWQMRVIKDFLKTGNPLKTWTNYASNNRGMSAYHDVIDWVGGYPFEVAKPEDVFSFFKNKGFALEHLKTCAGGLGCNEFIFKKVA